MYSVKSASFWFAFGTMSVILLRVWQNQTLPYTFKGDCSFLHQHLFPGQYTECALALIRLLGFKSLFKKEPRLWKLPFLLSRSVFYGIPWTSEDAFLCRDKRGRRLHSTKLRNLAGWNLKQCLQTYNPALLQVITEGWAGRKVLYIKGKPSCKLFAAF